MNAVNDKTATDYEQTIALIPGVLAARVVLDQQSIIEAHVLGDTSRHPMQLVRDIESSLMARYGIRVDRRRISVAQIDPGVPDQPRLVLNTINLSISGNEAEVRADLIWKDRHISGVAQGAATSHGKLVLAAQAVLHAVNELLPASVNFAFETLDTAHINGDDAVLVLATLVQPQQTESLAGAAFVRRDETEAAGRAALAAVNRRLTTFLEL